MDIRRPGSPTHWGPGPSLLLTWSLNLHLSLSLHLGQVEMNLSAFRRLPAGTIYVAWTSNSGLLPSATQPERGSSTASIERCLFGAPWRQSHEHWRDTQDIQAMQGLQKPGEGLRGLG